MTGTLTKLIVRVLRGVVREERDGLNDGRMNAERGCELDSGGRAGADRGADVRDSGVRANGSERRVVQGTVVTFEEKLRLLAAEVVLWTEDGDGDREKAVERMAEDPRFRTLTDVVTRRLRFALRDLEPLGPSGRQSE